MNDTKSTAETPDMEQLKPCRLRCGLPLIDLKLFKIDSQNVVPKYSLPSRNLQRGSL